MQRSYSWFKAPDFNSRWCKCVTIEHTVIWVKTCFSYSRWKLFPERFFFITGSCWPPDSNFTIRNVHPSNILRFWIETYCWYFWFKNHLGILCCAFCNITLSFLLILTTVFKNNPNCRSLSFYIPFVAWKMHFFFTFFWPKITIMTLLA